MQLLEILTDACIVVKKRTKGGGQGVWAASLERLKNVRVGIEGGEERVRL